MLVFPVVFVFFPLVLPFICRLVVSGSLDASLHLFPFMSCQRCIVASGFPCVFAYTACPHGEILTVEVAADA